MDLNLPEIQLVAVVGFCQNVKSKNGTDRLGKDSCKCNAEDPRVRVIGDAEKVGNLLTVIRAAYAAAYEI